MHNKHNWKQNEKLVFYNPSMYIICVYKGINVYTFVYTLVFFYYYILVYGMISEWKWST